MTTSHFGTLRYSGVQELNLHIHEEKGKIQKSNKT